MNSAIALPRRPTSSSSTGRGSAAARRAAAPPLRRLRPPRLRPRGARTPWASSAAAGEGPSSSSSSSGSSSSSSSGGGLAGAWRRFNAKTAQLTGQLQALGLAGVFSYGLLNTVYYTVSFTGVWFTVAQVPSGLGLRAAAQRALEVFALVWAGSQVTKLLRAAGALALAPLVDRALQLGVDRSGGWVKSKEQAFALGVAGCVALAAAVFGAVVVLHM